MPNFVLIPQCYRTLCWKLVFENQLFLALFSYPLFFTFSKLTELCIKYVFSFFVGQFGLSFINTVPIIYFQPKIKLSLKAD